MWAALNARIDSEQRASAAACRNCSQPAVVTVGVVGPTGVMRRSERHRYAHRSLVITRDPGSAV